MQLIYRGTSDLCKVSVLRDYCMDVVLSDMKVMRSSPPPYMQSNMQGKQICSIGYSKFFCVLFAIFLREVSQINPVINYR